MPPYAIILPAAGASSRFGASSKLLAPFVGGPVLAHTLEFWLLQAADLVVMPVRSSGEVMSGEYLGLREMMNDPRIRRCRGGPSRAHSVKNGLEEIPDYIEWVVVHDAARPLVTFELFDRTFQAAIRYGAAVPALPVVSTIKQATGPLPAKVERTISRSTLWAVQTPQIMRREALAAAFAACPIPLEQVTDEAQLLELAGQEVWLVAGDPRNIKITTPDDLKIARMYVEEEHAES